VFDDPFFRDPFMRRSSHGDPFSDGLSGDPFFGGGLGGSLFGGGIRGDPFGSLGGGGRGADPFASLHQQMDQMLGAHQSMMSGFHSDRGFQPSSSQKTVTYSSSSFRGGSGRNSVSKTSTTRIVNGKKQIVTEHIVTNPDGTVERTVETSQDDGFPQLSANTNEQKRFLGWDPEEGGLRPRSTGNAEHKRKRRSSKQNST